MEDISINLVKATGQEFYSEDDILELGYHENGKSWANKWYLYFNAEYKSFSNSTRLIKEAKRLISEYHLKSEL